MCVKLPVLSSIGVLVSITFLSLPFGILNGTIDGTAIEPAVILVKDLFYLGKLALNILNESL